MLPACCRAVLVALVLSIGGTSSASAQSFPQPDGHVNDFASLLTVEDRTLLSSQLTELEEATSAELALVTIRSLEGRSVEEYATALFAEWGIGKKGSDNGVLILVAPDDRAMRIEVGYGLEGVLPDGLAGAVIRETFLPRFRDDDYRTGILEGTARVAGIIRRHETLTPEQRDALDQATRDEGKVGAVAAVMSPLLSASTFMAGAAIGAKASGILVMGGFFTLFFAVLVLGHAPAWALPPLGVLVLVMFIAGIRKGRQPSWRKSLRGTGKGSSGTGWVSGSSGRSSSSSSSSGRSSGGFGGGRSGGGGASGRW